MGSRVGTTSLRRLLYFVSCVLVAQCLAGISAMPPVRHAVAIAEPLFDLNEAFPGLHMDHAFPSVLGPMEHVPLHFEGFKDKLKREVGVVGLSFHSGMYADERQTLANAGPMTIFNDVGPWITVGVSFSSAEKCDAFANDVHNVAKVKKWRDQLFAFEKTEFGNGHSSAAIAETSLNMSHDPPGGDKMVEILNGAWRQEEGPIDFALGDIKWYLESRGIVDLYVIRGGTQRQRRALHKLRKTSLEAEEERLVHLEEENDHAVTITFSSDQAQAIYFADRPAIAVLRNFGYMLHGVPSIANQRFRSIELIKITQLNFA